MTGRFTQLGRQLRKLRHIVGGAPEAEPTTTLRRATQLACDLACEAADVGDAQAGFHDLAERGVLERELAERLAGYASAVAKGGASSELPAGAMSIGRDLDRLLRSLEIGAPAPELAFEPLVPRQGGTKPDSTAAVVISGRVVELDVRDGHAVLSLDEQPLPMTRGGSEVASFALAAAPLSRPDVHREPTGATRVVWSAEKLEIELAPDLARARVE